MPGTLLSAMEAQAGRQPGEKGFPKEVVLMLSLDCHELARKIKLLALVCGKVWRQEKCGVFRKELLPPGMWNTGPERRD